MNDPPAKASSVHPSVAAAPDDVALPDVSQPPPADAGAARASSSIPATVPVASASANMPPQRSPSPERSPPSSTLAAPVRSATPTGSALVLAKVVRYVPCCFLSTRSLRFQPSQDDPCTRRVHLCAERADRRVECDGARELELNGDCRVDRDAVVRLERGS
jgi:hypothetical protein